MRMADRAEGRCGGWVVALCGLAVLAASAGCGRARTSSNSMEFAPVAPAALEPNGMETVWHSQLLLDRGTKVTNTWLREGYLVCLANNNRLYVLNATSGVFLWSRVVAESYQSVYAPAVYEGTLYVANTVNLMALRLSDGRLLNEQPLGFAPCGGLVTNGQFVYVPSTGGLKAVAIVPRTMSWDRWTEDIVTAVPVLDRTRVYFASNSGEVLASAQHIRKVTWTYQTGGAIVADLKQTAGGLVLVASLDYSLYAINGATGRCEWRFDAGEPLDRPPYTEGSQVFVFSEGLGLSVLDAVGGAVQWQQADALSLVSLSTDTLYYLTLDGTLAAAARTDGKVRFAVPVRAGSLVAVNETGSGVLYMIGSEGLVQAVAPKRTPGD